MLKIDRGCVYKAGIILILLIVQKSWAADGLNWKNCGETGRFETNRFQDSREILTLTKCFYDEEGRLIFWATYIQAKEQAFAGFPEVLARQQAFNEWVHRHFPAAYFSYPYQPDSWGWSNASPKRHLPGKLQADGRLNLMTLGIPLYVDRFRLSWLRKKVSESLANQTIKLEQIFAAIDTSIAKYAELLEQFGNGIFEKNLYGHDDVGDALENGHLEPGDIPEYIVSALEAAHSEVEQGLSAAAKIIHDPLDPLPEPPEVICGGFFEGVRASRLPTTLSEKGRQSIINRAMNGWSSECQFGKDCFFDGDGRLRSWLGTSRAGQELRAAAGFAPIKEQQEDFNDWAASRQPEGAPKLEASGQLNPQTLKIPVYKAMYRSDKLWSRLMRDASTAYPEFVSITIEEYAKDLSEYSLPNSYLAARAKAILRGREAALRYERAVDSMKDPMETFGWGQDRLPSKILEILTPIDREIEEALSTAEALE